MTQSDYVRWARSFVGSGYIYGATGWVCSQKRLEAQAKQYPAQANTILTVGKKWIGSKCWDCAQMTRTLLLEVGINLPSGATSQWKSDKYSTRETMSTFPAGELAIQLFRQSRDNKNVMQHTGLSLGNGRTIDARSTNLGVIESPVGSSWTHWARLKNLNWDDKPPTPDNPVPYRVTAPRAELNVRDSPDVRGKWLASMAKGRITSVVATENGWARHEYAPGKFGYSSLTYLERVVN